MKSISADVDLGSMAHMLRSWAHTTPDQPAIAVVGGEQRTFGQWWQRSRQLATRFTESHIGPGATVAFLGRSAVTWGEVIVAASLTGAAATPLNWRLSKQELSDVMADATPTVTVVEREFFALLGIDGDSDAPTAGVFANGQHIDYAHWLDSAQPTDAEPSAAPEAIALIVYTSGTSGLPKGVEISNRAIEANLRTPAPWDIRAGDVIMIPTPLFHVSGTGWLFYCLGIGATSLYLLDIEPGLVLELFGSGTVDHALTVPAVVQMLVQHPDSLNHDYAALRTLIYGGSPMSPTIATAAMKLFDCDLVQSYGMTETSGPITFLSPHDHRGADSLLSAAGRPAPGVEVTTIDPLTLTETQIGHAGEVWTRSSLLLSGYHNRPEELAAAMTSDGWFRTGDVGYFDSSGYLYLCDRIKDMIVSGGENVYPVEVENVLMSHPDVTDVAVIGVPDERWGETVKAIVVIGEDGPSEPELIAYARERLAHYKCPTTVDLVHELPRNPSGKILKNQLRAAFWKGHDRAIG